MVMLIWLNILSAVLFQWTVVTSQSILTDYSLLCPLSCCKRTIKELNAFIVQWYWICKSTVENESVQPILIITDYYDAWNSFAVLEAITFWVLLHWWDLACIVLCFSIWFEAYLKFSLANSWTGSCFLSVHTYAHAFSVMCVNVKAHTKNIRMQTWVPG